MKKILLCIFIFSVSQVHAQWIDSLSVVPSNPSVNDSVYVLASCSFSAASCDQHTQSHNIAGFNISAGALHCVGMLTMICPYTDTFSLGMLPAGIYTFTFQVNEGGLPAPCTPGIVPGPSSLFSFTVSTTTAVQQQHSADGMISVFPNPVRDRITVKLKTPQPVVVKIFNVDGKKIIEQNISSEYGEIYVGDLHTGIYFLEINTYHFRFVKE